MHSIAERLEHIHQRIASACHAHGLGPAAVQLLAVSKTFGPEAVLAAVRAGQRDFGENYVQEGVTKRQAVIEALRAQSEPGPRGEARLQNSLRWHFIGPLQSNKTRDVAVHFDWVHSVDRLKIAQRLAQQRPAELPALQVCLQVNIDEEPTKSGVLPRALLEEGLALARLCQETDRLQFRGLMAIPSAENNPVKQREAFAQLRLQLIELNQAISAQSIQIPELDSLSMGMSADLESAIAESSSALTTWVRVGSGIFGHRGPKP